MATQVFLWRTTFQKIQESESLWMNAEKVKWSVYPPWNYWLVSKIFYFHPENWGRWTHFDHYFSKGLVQPPTRQRVRTWNFDAWKMCSGFLLGLGLLVSEKKMALRLIPKHGRPDLDLRMSQIFGEFRREVLKVKECYTCWWFQTYFIFTPTWGKWFNSTIIFQMGWNHQLV